MSRKTTPILLLVIFSLTCVVNTCRVFEKINVNLYDDPDSITKINVRNTTIINLCKNAITNLNNLQTIRLFSNNISQIEPGAFVNIPSIRSIIIMGNQIVNIDEGVFNNLLMRKLDLTSNGITKISPNALSNLPKLEVLILDKNKIKTVHKEWFNNTPKLYRLSIMDNSIATIPEDAFQHLSGKQLRPQELDFWLSRNVINEIHETAFKNIEKINTLWLNENKLNVDLFDSIAHIKTIYLYLNNNRIKCIDDKLMSKLNVKELEIDDNPIECVCLKKMKKSAKSKQMQFSAFKRGIECLKDRIKKLGSD